MQIPIIFLLLVGQLYLSDGKSHSSKNAKCNLGYQKFENLCIKKYAYELSYANAQSVCESQGAELVKGSTRDLIEKLKTLDAKKTAVDAAYWTGNNEPIGNNVDRNIYALALRIIGNSVDFIPENRQTGLRYICEKPQNSDKGTKANRKKDESIERKLQKQADKMEMKLQKAKEKMEKQAEKMEKKLQKVEEKKEKQAEKMEKKLQKAEEKKEKQAEKMEKKLQKVEEKKEKQAEKMEKKLQKAEEKKEKQAEKMEKKFQNDEEKMDRKLNKVEEKKENEEEKMEKKLQKEEEKMEMKLQKEEEKMEKKLLKDAERMEKILQKEEENDDARKSSTSSISSESSESCSSEGCVAKSSTSSISSESSESEEEPFTDEFDSDSSTITCKASNIFLYLLLCVFITNN